MRENPTGARGFRNPHVFASSTIFTIICLFFSVSGASAREARELRFITDEQPQLNRKLGRAKASSSKASSKSFIRL